jgi:flagellar biosynthesis/type III secretory pathway ATPase
MAHYAQAVENINALVERGRAIEDFDEKILKKQMSARGDREHP